MVRDDWRNSATFDPRRMRRGTEPLFMARGLAESATVPPFLARMEHDAERRPGTPRAAPRVPELRDNALATIAEFEKNMTLYARGLRHALPRDYLRRPQRILHDRFARDLRAARQFVVDEPTLEQVARRCFDENPDGARLTHQLLAAPHACCWFECRTRGTAIESPYHDTHETWLVAQSCMLREIGDYALSLQPFVSLQFVPRHRQFGTGVRTETLPNGLGFTILLEGCPRELREENLELLRMAHEWDHEHGNAYVRETTTFIANAERAWRTSEPVRGLAEHVVTHTELSHLAYAWMSTDVVEGTLRRHRTPQRTADGINDALERLASPVNPMQWLALIAHVNAAAPPERNDAAPPVDENNLVVPSHVDYHERSVVRIVLDRSYADFARRARRSIRIIRRKKRHEVRAHWRHRYTDRACRDASGPRGGAHEWVDTTEPGATRRTQRCGCCGSTRTLLPKHERGDATLGYVVHTYDVVLGRTIREEI